MKIRRRYIIAAIVLIANALFMYFSLRPTPRKPFETPEELFRAIKKGLDEAPNICITTYTFNDEPAEANEQGLSE